MRTGDDTGAGGHPGIAALAEVAGVDRSVIVHESVLDRLVRHPAFAHLDDRATVGARERRRVALVATVWDAAVRRLYRGGTAGFEAALRRTRDLSSEAERALERHEANIGALERRVDQVADLLQRYEMIAGLDIAVAPSTAGLPPGDDQHPVVVVEPAGDLGAVGFYISGVPKQHRRALPRVDGHPEVDLYRLRDPARVLGISESELKRTRAEVEGAELRAHLLRVQVAVSEKVLDEYLVVGDVAPYDAVEAPRSHHEQMHLDALCEDRPYLRSRVADAVAAGFGIKRSFEWFKRLTGGELAHSSESSLRSALKGALQHHLRDEVEAGGRKLVVILREEGGRDALRDPVPSFSEVTYLKPPER